MTKQISTFERTSNLGRMNSFIQHTALMAEKYEVEIDIIFSGSQNYILWVECTYKIVATGDKCNLSLFEESI